MTKIYYLRIKSGSTYKDFSDNLVTIKADDEIIWSANTGRTTSGKMIGTVIAEKKNVEIAWSMLTDDQVKAIKSNFTAGFFTMCFHDAGEDLEIKGYRGTLSKEHLGYIGDGIYYYKTATLSFVQQ